MQTVSQANIQTEAQTLFLKQVFHLCSTYLRLSAGLDLNPISSSFMNLHLSLHTIAGSCWVPSLIISTRPLCVCLHTHMAGRRDDSPMSKKSAECCTPKLSLAYKNHRLLTILSYIIHAECTQHSIVPALIVYKWVFASSGDGSSFKLPLLKVLL